MEHMNFGLIATAIIATIGILKFKLIDELVKKMLPENQKSKTVTILFLFGLIVILTVVSLSMDETEPSKEIVSNEDPVEPVTTMTPKTDMEVKQELIETGVKLTDDLVRQAKESKRKKDSTFIANRQARWAYRIGDWTDDDNKILEMHKLLLGTENIKLIKQRRKYLFIKEDAESQENLQASLDELKNELNGLAVGMIDLNTFLSRKHDDFVVRTESFGRRKKKIELECLVAE
jgi:hypothetical protein